MGAAADLRQSRRELLLGSAALALSTGGFGFVYGLAAHQARFSLLDVVAMSVLVFAGASQFAAVGYLAHGVPWAVVVLLTGLLNARHLLYSGSLAPRLRSVGVFQRAAMAQFLTDEAFALATAHFERLGRADAPGYWIGALAGAFIPFNVGTLAGYLAGGAVVDPSRLGLDAIFPAAMAGLAVGLLAGRSEVTAAGAGATIGLAASLLFGPGVGIVVGGLLGPAVALLLAGRARP